VGITVYGRKAIRRVERAIGEQIVHMAGPWVTTRDHKHLVWRGGDWHPATTSPADVDGSGCGVHLWSCGILFGRDTGGVPTHFMRGQCAAKPGCGAGPGQLHAWNCPHLQTILEMNTINPDYYPRPVHRPQWLDDPRRDRVRLDTRLMFQLALDLDVPIELMGTTPAFPNHWAVLGYEQDESLKATYRAAGARLLAEFGLDPKRYRLEFE
jgi:hypothetical protein